VVLEDAAGTRIEGVDQWRDYSKPANLYSNTANLVRAAGMIGKDRPALLVRLFVRPVANTVAAAPLAALTTKHHLRQGL
jgi:hypothetical protein